MLTPSGQPPDADATSFFALRSSPSIISVDAVEGGTERMRWRLQVL
jgi:hypothetical protein